MWDDYGFLDRMAYRSAKDRGKPLPKLVLSEELAERIARAEAKYGLRILVRPHTFLRYRVSGTVNLEDGVMTLLARPDWPEEYTRRSFYHELGHVEQEQGGNSFDRHTIEEFCECERDAHRRAWARAEGWGDGQFFPDDVREDLIRQIDETESAMEALADVAGTDDAIVLSSLVHYLLDFTDEIVGDQLRERFGDPPGDMAALASMIWSAPELFTQYNRSALRSCWNISHRGQPQDQEPLSLADPERAASTLADCMRHVRSRWTYSTDWRWQQPQLVRVDEKETIVTWLDVERAGEIVPFLDLVQTLVMQPPNDAPLRMAWHVTVSKKSSIYGVEIQWPDDDARPGWYALCAFGAYRSRRYQDQEDALRLFINTFRRICGVYSYEIHETMTRLVGLWMSSCGPAPVEALRLAG